MGPLRAPRRTRLESDWGRKHVGSRLLRILLQPSESGVLFRHGSDPTVREQHNHKFSGQFCEPLGKPAWGQSVSILFIFQCDVPVIRAIGNLSAESQTYLSESVESECAKTSG